MTDPTRPPVSARRVAIGFKSSSQVLSLRLADEALTGLRDAWVGMSSAERAIVGRTAAPLRARLDRLRAALPKRSALSEGAPERDPDEEIDPARAA